MNELHRQVTDGLSAIQAVVVSAIVELAEIGGLHIHLPSQLDKFIDFVRWHRHSHAFLGLGDKNLPGLQAGIL